MRGQAPVPLSLSRSEATRPFTTTTTLGRSYSIHSFDNYARGAVAGPARRPPPQYPNTLSHQARPCAARVPRTLPPEPRRGTLWSPRSQPRPPPHTSAHAPRPPSRESNGLRPASPPQTRRVRGAREARVHGGSPPGVQGRYARATRELKGLGGWARPTVHSPPLGQNRGSALSRLKPLGPPHTPQCPRCLLALGGPPIALLIGPFERTMGTRRPQP